VEIFYKNPEGLNFTALDADLSLLCFFWFWLPGDSFFVFLLCLEPADNNGCAWKNSLEQALG
jgi:hypothetical protein